MQNIHISRYSHSQGTGFQGAIEPDDRAWIVFIDNAGTATLWRRVESRPSEDDKVEHSYIDVEFPTALAQSDGTPPNVPLPPPSQGDGPLDFTVTPALEPFGDALDPAAHAQERLDHPEARKGFYASLSHRSIACWGETEHAAVRGLLNYVAQLCTAGSMDHTGGPMAGNDRRYKAVFGTD